MDGGRLVFAADRQAQWIGPSSQFALGLSDPSEWHPEKGPGADPGASLGAFAPLNYPFEDYRPLVQPGRIILTSPAGDVLKTYSLSTAGLRIDLTFPQSATIRIPLTLAPQDWLTPIGISRWQPQPKLEGERWIVAANCRRRAADHVSGSQPGFRLIFPGFCRLDERL